MHMERRNYGGNTVVTERPKPSWATAQLRLKTTSHDGEYISQMVRNKYLNVQHRSPRRSGSRWDHMQERFAHYKNMYLIHLPCHMLLGYIDSFFVYTVVNLLIFALVYFTCKYVLYGAQMALNC